MKKWYSIPGLVLAVAFLITSVFFISKSYTASEKFRETKTEIADILNFNDRILSARDWLFTEKTWLEKKAQFEEKMTEADQYLAIAKDNGKYLLYACILFFVIIVAIYARRRIYYGLTFAIAFVSMALLGQGVMNPIIEIAAYKEDVTIKLYIEADEIPYYEEAIEFLDGVAEYVGWVNSSVEFVKLIPASEDWVDDIEDFVGGYQELFIEGKRYLVENRDGHVGVDKVFPGKTYFYYQNKGIMEVIHLLWTTDNKAVAASIGTFSVIVPAIKLLCSLFILLFPVTGAKRLRKILSYIAKWSMADVFVVAMFLAYLSFANMSAGVTMESNVLFGLHFFMGYVILSIVLGFLLDASIKEKIKITERRLNLPDLRSEKDNEEGTTV